MVVRAASCLFTQSLTAMEVTTTVGSLIVLAQRIPKLLESPVAMARVPWYVPQTAGVSMEEWATGAEEIQRTRMSLVDSRSCRAEVAHGQAWGYCGVPHPGPSQDPSESCCPLTAGQLYCRM